MRSWTAEYVSKFGAENHEYAIALEEGAWWSFFISRWLVSKLDALVPALLLPPIPVRVKSTNGDGTIARKWAPLNQEHPDLRDLVYSKFLNKIENWARRRIKCLLVLYVSAEVAQNLFAEDILRFIS